MSKRETCELGIIVATIVTTIIFGVAFLFAFMFGYFSGIDTLSWFLTRNPFSGVFFSGMITMWIISFICVWIGEL